MHTQIHTRIVDSVWSSAGTVAVDTDWLAADVGQATDAQRNVAGIAGADGAPVKHNLQIMVPTSTIVNLQLKKDGITKVLDLNSGEALVANAGYNFSVILYSGQTYNIQHKTGTQNVAVTISESFNIDQ